MFNNKIAELAKKHENELEFNETDNLDDTNSDEIEDEEHTEDIELEKEYFEDELEESDLLPEVNEEEEDILENDQNIFGNVKKDFSKIIVLEGSDLQEQGNGKEENGK